MVKNGDNLLDFIENNVILYLKMECEFLSEISLKFNALICLKSAKIG